MYFIVNMVDDIQHIDFHWSKEIVSELTKVKTNKKVWDGFRWDTGAWAGIAIIQRAMELSEFGLGQGVEPLVARAMAKQNVSFRNSTSTALYVGLLQPQQEVKLLRRRQRIRYSSVDVLNYRSLRLRVRRYRVPIPCCILYCSGTVDIKISGNNNSWHRLWRLEICWVIDNPPAKKMLMEHNQISYRCMVQ